MRTSSPAVPKVIPHLAASVWNNSFMSSPKYYQHSARCFLLGHRQKVNFRALQSFRGIWDCTLNEAGTTLSAGERNDRWKSFVSNIETANGHIRLGDFSMLSGFDLHCVTRSRKFLLSASSRLLPEAFSRIAHIASLSPSPPSVSSFSPESRDKRFMLAVLAPVYGHLSASCKSLRVPGVRDRLAEFRWTNVVWRTTNDQYTELYDLINDGDLSFVSGSTSNTVTARCVKRRGLRLLRLAVSAIIKQADSVEMLGSTVATVSETSMSTSHGGEGVEDLGQEELNADKEPSGNTPEASDSEVIVVSPVSLRHARQDGSVSLPGLATQALSQVERDSVCD